MVASRPIARVLAVAFVPLLVAARPLVAPSVADGVSFTWKQTSTQRGFQPTEMQVRVMNHLARIDYKKAQPGFPSGTYMLLDAEKAQVTMVNPRDKTATILPVGGMMSVLGGLGASGMIKAEISDVSVEATDLGPGEPILGHPTHKHNVKQSYNVKVSVMGMRREMKMNSSMDTWVATDIPAAEARAMEEFGRNFVNAIGGAAAFGGDGMQKLQAEIMRTMPKGVHVKQVTTTTQVDQGGKEETSTMTSEMTEFNRGNIDPKIYEIPSNYTTKDLTAMMAEAEAQMAAAKAECEKEKGAGNCEDMGRVNYDSLRKAGMGDAAKDAMKNSPLGRLGGLLGRKPPPDTGKKPPR